MTKVNNKPMSSVMRILPTLSMRVGVGVDVDLRSKAWIGGGGGQSDCDLCDLCGGIWTPGHPHPMNCGPCRYRHHLFLLQLLRERDNMCRR